MNITIERLKKEGRYIGFVTGKGFIYEVPTLYGYDNKKVALFNGTITPYTGSINLARKK